MSAHGQSLPETANHRISFPSVTDSRILFNDFVGADLHHDGMLLTAPRPHHGIHSATVPGTCSRCAQPVALHAEAGADTTVICYVCVERLRPRSTWVGYAATGTWWLQEVLEHDASGSTDVVRSHGMELVRYRRDGRDLVLVDRVS